MRTRLLLLLTLPVGAALVAATGSGAAPQPAVAALWKKNCSTCHTVPDPTLPADRGWIGQIARTA